MTDTPVMEPGTALPWHVVLRNGNAFAYETNADIMKVMPAAEAKSGLTLHASEADIKAAKEANAAYIVRACNSFPALLEALEGLADCVFVGGLTENNTEEWMKARAALSLARSGDALAKGEVQP